MPQLEPARWEKAPAVAGTASGANAISRVRSPVAVDVNAPPDAPDAPDAATVVVEADEVWAEAWGRWRRTGAGVAVATGVPLVGCRSTPPPACVWVRD